MVLNLNLVKSPLPQIETFHFTFFDKGTNNELIQYKIHKTLSKITKSHPTF